MGGCAKRIWKKVSTMSDEELDPLRYLSEAARAAAQRPHNAALPAGLSVGALFDLAGRLAVITNVGGGGSREIAGLLASAGAHVVLADREIAGAQALAAGIRADGGVAAALDIDIESEISVAEGFTALAEAAGRFDLLINCAGMSGHTPLLDTTTALYDDLQSLNLRANFLCMREGVRHMVQAGRGGRILNVTTIGGRHPVLNGNGVYGAARVGVRALGDSIALDHAADGILVNTLMVGAVADRTLTHPKVAAELQAGRQLTGPMAGPNRALLGRGEMIDVASAVLFLVSPASRYVTGQALAVDGGFFLS